jgi:murein L,D-transpeptidase YcbB/YkuD
LVAWLLSGNPGWSYERIMSMKQTGEQINVQLAQPVPVYLAYITAWGTPDGQVHFRPDIYGVDGAAATASAY